jgi:hypothetical protein
MYCRLTVRRISFGLSCYFSVFDLTLCSSVGDLNFDFSMLDLSMADISMDCFAMTFASPL